MYTIKQASALTGVPADTLRAWERRYGVPSTSRSEGGYRLYDDHALDTVRRMRTLIDGGHWLGVLLLIGAVIGWFGGPAIE